MIFRTLFSSYSCVPKILKLFFVYNVQYIFFGRHVYKTKITNQHILCNKRKACFFKEFIFFHNFKLLNV